jgi:hypothetical protein
VRLYVHKAHKCAQFEKKIDAIFFYVFEDLAWLVKTWQRVKYLTLFVILIHASNSACNHTKLHCCALLSHISHHGLSCTIVEMPPHLSPWQDNIATSWRRF